MEFDKVCVTSVMDCMHCLCVDASVCLWGVYVCRWVHGVRVCVVYCYYHIIIAFFFLIFDFFVFLPQRLMTLIMTAAQPFPEQ